MPLFLALGSDAFGEKVVGLGSEGNQLSASGSKLLS